MVTKYKCGCKRHIVLLDSNFLSYMVYDEWKDSVGWNGDKSLCWECYCNKYHRNKKQNSEEK